MYVCIYVCMLLLLLLLLFWFSVVKNLLHNWFMCYVKIGRKGKSKEFPVHAMNPYGEWRYSSTHA